MKYNRLVEIEKTSRTELIIRKARGKLTVDDIYDALDANDLEDSFALFIKGPRFTGWESVDHDTILSVLLQNLTEADNCPFCGKLWEGMREQLYESAYQDGYKAGKEAAEG